MHLSAYLSFSGNCAEAFAFYARCLGANAVFTMRYSESPVADRVPPDFRDKIMHTRMQVSGSTLMGSDAPPDRYARAAGTAVCIGVDDPAEADRVFAALAEGGRVGMPIQETFWARRFGMLTDGFGIPWMVDREKPE